MTDRYQDRPFPLEERGSPRAPASGDSDPLAELARLIGQTDPLSGFGRANQPMRPEQPRQELEPETEEPPQVSPPSWMRRRQQAAPPQVFEESVHPVRRYAAAHPAPEPEYHETAPFAPGPDQHPQPD